MKVYSYIKPLVAIAIASVAVTAHAMLKFEQEVISVESGLFDDRAVGVFRFENVGTTAVEILHISASCGCTVPTLTKRLYEPGESGEIEAIFTFGGRQGQQNNTIHIQTNDAQNPQHRLRLETRIPDWAQRTPPLVRWQLNAEPQPQRVELKEIHPNARFVGIHGHMNNFELVQVESEGAGSVVFEITPKSTEAWVNEQFAFILEAKDASGQSSQRLIRVFAMVR